MIKTDAAGYVYDETSGAVINTNRHEYEIYKSQRDTAKNTKKLEQELADLRALVTKIVTEKGPLNV